MCMYIYCSVGRALDGWMYSYSYILIIRNPPPTPPPKPDSRDPGLWGPPDGLRNGRPGLPTDQKIIGEVPRRPKTAQDRSKGGRHDLKMAQEAPKTPQQAWKTTPKRQNSPHSLRKTDTFDIFVTSTLPRPRRPKRLPRSPQDGRRDLQEGSRTAQETPKTAP